MSKATMSVVERKLPDDVDKNKQYRMWALDFYCTSVDEEKDKEIRSTVVRIMDYLSSYIDFVWQMEHNSYFAPIGAVAYFVEQTLGLEASPNLSLHEIEARLSKEILGYVDEYNWRS